MKHVAEYCAVFVLLITFCLYVTYIVDSPKCSCGSLCENLVHFFYTALFMLILNATLAAILQNKHPLNNLNDKSLVERLIVDLLIYLCLSICLSVCLSVCLLVCLPVCLSSYLLLHVPSYLFSLTIKVWCYLVQEKHLISFLTIC